MRADFKAALALAALFLVPAASADSNRTENSNCIVQNQGDGAHITVTCKDPQDTETIKNLNDLLRAKNLTLQELESQIEEQTDSYNRLLVEVEKGGPLALKAQQALDRLRAGESAEVMRPVLLAIADEFQKGPIREAAKIQRELGSLAYNGQTFIALGHYQRSTELDPKNADGWNQLGLLLKRVGKLTQATEAYQKVLGIGEDDLMLQAVAFGNLGLIYKTQGDLARAEEYHRKALDLNTELGRKEGMASDYGNLGNVYQTQGDLARAEEYYRKALDLNTELGRKEGMASDYGNLGLIYRTQGDLARAEEYHRKSLDLSTELGRKAGMAIQHVNLGSIYEQKDQFDQAGDAWRLSLRLFEEMGSYHADTVRSWLEDLEATLAEASP